MCTLRHWRRQIIAGSRGARAPVLVPPNVYMSQDFTCKHGRNPSLCDPRKASRTSEKARTNNQGHLVKKLLVMVVHAAVEVSYFMTRSSTRKTIQSSLNEDTTTEQYVRLFPEKIFWGKTEDHI